MKKKIFKTVFVAAITLMLFGCVIKQEIYFNKDFSGRYKYTFDFTEYISYMGGGEEETDDSLMMKNEDFEEYLSYVKKELKNISGISDIKIFNDADNGTVYFSYNFANVDALNAAMKFSSLMALEPVENAPYFNAKKKNLTYIRHATPKEEIEETEEGGEDTDYMNDFFRWEFVLEFEADVKKFDVQKDTMLTISNNNKTFVENGNIFNVAEKESKWVFKTK
jgi:hypothetical protein